jgi:hypothetical protein
MFNINYEVERLTHAMTQYDIMWVVCIVLVSPSSTGIDGSESSILENEKMVLKASMKNGCQRGEVESEDFVVSGDAAGATYASKCFYTRQLFCLCYSSVKSLRSLAGRFHVIEFLSLEELPNQAQWSTLRRREGLLLIPSSILTGYVTFRTPHDRYLLLRQVVVCFDNTIVQSVQVKRYQVNLCHIWRGTRAIGVSLSS